MTETYLTELATPATQPKIPRVRLPWRDELATEADRVVSTAPQRGVGPVR